MGKYRNSVFIVVYFENKEAKKNKNEIGEIEYLLLKRELHWKGWEFPKGGIENNESIKKAVERELKEETGIETKNKIKSFNVKGEYDYDKEYPDREGIIGQKFSLYAIDAGKKKSISLDKREHSDYQWLPFEQAIKKLTWPNQKECLKIVNDWLFRKNFRKMISDNNSLILAGKDDESNEKLVKQAEENEELFHTSSPGSPFANIKGIPKKGDRKQAAIFCARYSREWKENKKDVEVHNFKKKNTSKREGMKKGTFGVKNVKKILIKKEDIKSFKTR